MKSSYSFENRGTETEGRNLFQIVATLKDLSN